MIQNKQSHRHSLCIVMSHIVHLHNCPIKLNILTKNRVKKILQKKLYSEFKISFQSRKDITLSRMKIQATYVSKCFQKQVRCVSTKLKLNLYCCLSCKPKSVLILPFLLNILFNGNLKLSLHCPTRFAFITVLNWLSQHAR